ncbi:MAG TPA: hypothetical protein VGQ83_26705 [Polyangia bacterium]|jgi:hypothetical protein
MLQTETRPTDYTPTPGDWNFARRPPSRRRKIRVVEEGQQDRDCTVERDRAKQATALIQSALDLIDHGDPTGANRLFQRAAYVLLGDNDPSPPEWSGAVESLIDEGIGHAIACFDTLAARRAADALEALAQARDCLHLACVVLAGRGGVA